MSSTQRQGALLILLAATGYAFLPIFGRNIYTLSPHFQPADVALWRFIFAVPVIWLIVLLRQQRKTRKEAASRMPHRWLPLLGMLYAIAAFTAFAGLERISASLYVVLFYTYPAMVALLSLFLGQRLSLYGWLALVVTLIGIFLTLPDLSQLAGNDIIGILIAFANAFVVAIYFLVNSHALRGVRRMGMATAYLMTYTLSILLVLSVLLVGVTIPANLATWLNLLGLGIICTAIPIFLVSVGIQMIGAPQAAIISAIEPAQAMLLAMILLGEVILPLQWVGAFLIMGGVLLLQIKPRQKMALN